MKYYFAPMEGVTGAEFRRAHHQVFGGVDAYYTPFLSPTQDHVFTPRELRGILPENNPGFRIVPQLLTRNADDFLWAAGELAAMGYDEVNLNLGCPSGTVTAKGKGAGLLQPQRREDLERLLDEIFAKSPVPLSIKTRLGWEDPEEFGPLLELFSRYPAALLIIHPRVRQDFYREKVRLDAFAQALEVYPGPVCFNGGLVTPEHCAAFARRFPQVEQVMIGQGLLADPALARKVRGGTAATLDELRAFHETLYRTYLSLFSGERSTVFHMKELWSYLSRLFEDSQRPLKKIRKADRCAPYEAAVEEMFARPLARDALWSPGADTDFS